MIFHFITKQLKWSYGRYAHSGIRVRPKTRKNDKFEKGLFLSKGKAQAERLILLTRHKIDEIDNSQMQCKCYTRYKSNPIYQISQINCKTPNPTILGNFDFWFLSYVYQNWLFGLDSDRFCAPEHIIEMSNSSIFEILDFSWKMGINKV